MYAVVGILFLATASTMSAWAFVQFRRANRSRWTERELPVTVITLLELTLVPCGTIIFGRYLVDVAEQPFGWTEGAMIAVFAVTLLLSVTLLRASWRVRHKRRRLVLTRSLPRHSEPRDSRTNFSMRQRHGAASVRLRPTSHGRGPVERKAA